MEIIHEEELRAHLRQTNEEFRTLSEKHSEYDRILTGLESKAHLTNDEQLEEVRLKKLKLHAKDLMTDLLARHRVQVV
ncbi:MAG: YdcH family protein [Acidobacteriia bacterium]|nr:YdcH family protein [Terriglobia bacterium]